MRRVAVVSTLVLSLAGTTDATAKSVLAEAAVRACDRVVVYRYAVTVTGAKSGRETFPPDSDFSGDFSLSYDYLVRYPAVRVRVDRGCDPEITTLRARGRGTGTLRNYTWADHAVQRDPNGTKVPCDFQFTSDPFPTRLSAVGGTTVLGGGPSTFSIQSQVNRAQEPAVLGLIDARRAEVCDKGSFPNLRASDELAVHRSVPIFDNSVRVGNVKVEPPGIFLHGSLLGGGRKNPRALARLVAGRSVRVSTGTRRYEGTDDQTSATASTAVTIRFERRR
jgi:hypothetical protein